MGSWIQDLRFAWRGLRLRPLSTAAIVGTLALAMGAQLAILRVFDAVVVRPLPFADDQRLVRLYIEPLERSGERLSPGADVLLALQRETRSFAAVVGQRYMELTLHRPEGPERVAVIGVTSGWSRTLGIAPAHGRTFTASEEREGLASGVALVSHATWQGLLGGDPRLLGRTLRLGERSMTVVGVMPPGFAFPYDAQMWVPHRPELDAVGPWGYFIPARLAPGVGVEAANRELAALASRRADLPGRTLTAVPLREVLLGERRGVAVVLLGGVAFLLLLVCANLANLFLVRTLGRGRELAVRAALGASHAGLARLLLSESLLVSGLAAAAALLVAGAALPLARGLLPEDLHRLGGLPVADARIALTSLGVAVTTALLVGLLPVLRLRDTAGVVRGGRSSAPAHRLRGLLVSAEVAAALVLLAGAVLLTRDLVRRQRLDLGYPAEGLLTLSVSLVDEAEPLARARKVDRILAALEALPGVSEAGATCIFPSPEGNYVTATLVEGEPEHAPRLVNHRLVTPGFLAALGVRVVEGRTLTAADVEGAEAVAVVSTSLARRRWPEGSAVGRTIREARPGEEPRWLTVVGVVSDVAEFYDVADAWYLPLAQHVDSPRATAMTFVLRAAGEVGGLEAAARQAVATVDPALPVADVATPQAIYAASLASQRSTGMLATAFGALALLVAVVGVYAAMAAWAAERRRELAIRVAVGASPARALRALAGPGIQVLLVGLAIGGTAVLALRAVLPRLVADLDPSPQVPLAVGAALLGVAGVVACLAPARRILRQDSATVLREE